MVDHDYSTGMVRGLFSELLRDGLPLAQGACTASGCTPRADTRAFRDPARLHHFMGRDHREGCRGNLFTYGLARLQGLHRQWIRPWPDRAGRFPWEDGADDYCRTSQPLLWIPKSDTNGPWAQVA